MELTAKDIIERLINEDKISGKEAFILIEAITKKNDNSFTYSPSFVTPYTPYKPYEIWCSTTD